MPPEILCLWGIRFLLANLDRGVLLYEQLLEYRRRHVAGAHYGVADGGFWRFSVIVIVCALARVDLGEASMVRLY